MKKKDTLKVCIVCGVSLKGEEQVYVVGKGILCFSCLRDLVFGKEK